MVKKNVVSNPEKPAPALEIDTCHTNMEYSGLQFAQIVYETAQWLNEIFVQNNRFLEEYRYRSGNPFDPWDDKGREHNYLAERYFLISAIHHAFKGLKKIDDAISGMGDTSLAKILAEIFDVVPWDKTKICVI